MRTGILASLAICGLMTGALVFAHGTHYHAVTIGKGPSLSVGFLPGAPLDTDRMHSIYLSNLTDFAIDRVAIVSMSDTTAPAHWTVLDPPLGRTCPHPHPQRCFDQKYYRRITLSPCGAAYRVLVSWPMPNELRGQAVADSIVADCNSLHGLVVTLQ